MMQLLESFTHIEGLIALLSAFATFATVITVAAPYFNNDKLAGRIKLVSSERDRLRAQQKATLDAGTVRLRDRKSGSMSSGVV